MMPVNPLIAVSALACGVVAGWMAGVLIQRREMGHHFESAVPPHSPSVQVLPGGSLPPWAHALLMGGLALVLALLPPFGDPRVLGGVLLYLIITYPLGWIDLGTLTVEPLLVLGGIALRALAVMLLDPADAWTSLQGLLAGAGLLYLVGFAYRELRGREGLGEGDAAVMGLIGSFVGLSGLLPVLILATGLGLVGGGGMLLWRRSPMNTPLPFVPFLCLAGLAVLVMQHWSGVPPFWPWGGMG